MSYFYSSPINQMLREITIEDLTVIDNILIELEEGLNVLTGETGAGKSIIVDALGLVLGARAQSDMIKIGKQKAEVTAFFETTTENPVTSRLSIDTSDGIVIRRILSSNGKNRSFINDSSVSTTTLAEIGTTLVDIHSQHENQSLMSPETQLKLLDNFGKTFNEMMDYTNQLALYNSINDEIETLSQNIKQRNSKIDMLKFQIEEIEGAGLQPNELEHLTEQQNILSNLSTIKQISEDSYSLIYSSNNSLTDHICQVVTSFNKLTEIDPEASEMSEMASQAEAIIKELHLSLRGYKENIELSPDILDQVQERIVLINKMQKKYGIDISAIIEHARASNIELQILINAEDTLLELSEKLLKVKGELTNSGQKLSKKRQETAVILSKKIQAILKELSFEKAEFTIAVKQNIDSEGSYRFQKSGIDNVEYLFSANPGVPQRPIQKTASGGELSRVMLGLKTVFAEFDKIPVLIFDEVDAGIGGETAEVVGEKLKAISKNHQVLCITHLPQIAAKADNHLKVIKDVSGETVKISVNRLDKEQRQHEIARMLSGSETEISLEHARQLIGA